MKKTRKEKKKKRKKRKEMKRKRKERQNGKERKKETILNPLRKRKKGEWRKRKRRVIKRKRGHSLGATVGKAEAAYKIGTSQLELVVGTDLTQATYNSATE